MGGEERGGGICVRGLNVEGARVPQREILFKIKRGGGRGV